MNQARAAFLRNEAIRRCLFKHEPDSLAALQAGKRPAASLGAVSTTRYVSHCLTENDELFEEI